MNIRVSIVIPVYNEAPQLAACLEAIARQTVTPFEVLVVDNNSSDTSAAVARRFPFVNLLAEPKQGVIHARTTGFNAARGDVIARIDADTVMPDNWVATVQSTFLDPGLSAVSGAAEYYNVALQDTFNAIDLFFRRRLARQLKNRVYLWGANMAMRRSAWQSVQPQLCTRGGMHEDFDLAIHLQENGAKVIFDERLKAQTSSRRADVNYLDFMRYVLMSPNTYAQHRIRGRFYMYQVVILCAIAYWPIRVLHRGYNPATGGFSLTRAVTYRSLLPVRVDPTTNVA